MLKNRPVRDDDFAKMLVRIILQSINPDNRVAFINRLTSETPPDVQVKLYEFVKAMICAWAERDDLSREDAGAIEDCRKICDLMGWPRGLW